MRLAVLTCGMLPIPAVRGGAVENLIDFYLEYNDRKKIHHITVYSPWDVKVKENTSISSDVNHYCYIDVTSIKARIERRIYKYLHKNEYYNYFIEYYFEKVYSDLKNKKYDYILLENSPGLAYKLSERGYKNILLHLHNDLLNSHSHCHDEIAKNVIKVITVSNFIKKSVSTVYPFKNIYTVYNGIDTMMFSQKDKSIVRRQDLGFSEDDFIMVYSGRINKDKGISELIDAMLEIQKIPNIKLLVLGSTFFDNSKQEDEFFKNLRKKSEIIKRNIIFTGFIPYEKVPRYLQLADIAVLPSMWNEPFGLTIVEAMAAGLPLITTRSGGIPEICEGVATIVDRENIVEHLTDAILDLYHHPDKRKQMANTSLERAKMFDKEAYAKNFFAALEDLEGNC